MKRMPGCLLTVILCALIGFVIGHASTYWRASGRFIAWEPAPLPDGQQAKHFVTEPTTRGPSVYIATEQGKSFVQHLESVHDEVAWEEVEQADPEGEAFSHGLCSFENLHQGYQIRQPPGVVVEQLDCEVVYIEWSDAYRYVILDNGDVWRWKMQGVDAMASAVFSMIYPFGCAVGAGIFGLSIFILWASFRDYSGIEQDGDVG